MASAPDDATDRAQEQALERTDIQLLPAQNNNALTWCTSLRLHHQNLSALVAHQAP